MTAVRVVLAGPEAALSFDPDQLSPRDLERWRKGFVREEKRREFAASRVLLASVGLREFEFGPGRHASLTHSRGHAAIAIAPPGWCIGIDLEWQRPRDVPGLESWCYSDAELAAAAALSAEERARKFLLRWAIKEAGLKALGLRFPGGLREVDVTFDGDRPSLVRLPGQRSHRTWAWRPREDCVLSVVAIPTEGALPAADEVDARELRGGRSEWDLLLAPA